MIVYDLRKGAQNRISTKIGKADLVDVSDISIEFDGDLSRNSANRMIAHGKFY